MPARLNKYHFTGSPRPVWFKLIIFVRVSITATTYIL